MNIATLLVSRIETLRDALTKIDRSGIGLAVLTNAHGQFERTVTDGDLRRLLLDGHALDAQLAALPQINSITVTDGVTRREALQLMNQHSINHLPVLDADRHVVDILDRKELGDHILLSTPHMGDAEREYVEEAFRTNWIAPLGPNVDAFEAELANYVGIGHAAAVSSGTAAIHLALVLLKVGAGDTVFCSSLTFSASANPIVYLGATPVFIDSEAESWNMSPAALERAFAAAAGRGKLPKAVVVVNLYGQSADMDPICAICDHYGVPIVEDAAESLGATYKGRQSGTFGKIGIFSFNGNKIITTSGGGMLIADDPDLVARARFLATQARDPAPHYQHSEIGYNYRMSNILAGVGRGQLAVLDERIAARRAVFDRYRTELWDIPGLTWMPEPSWSCSNRWLTTCTIDPSRLPNRSEVARRLAEELIEVRPVWKPMHLQPIFASCDYYTAGDESLSDRLFEHGLCLPSGSNMSDMQLDRIITTLRAALAA